MAKIHTEYDTNEKSLKTHIDGKAVPNVVGVRHYKYGTDKDGKDQYGIEVTSHEKNEEHDMGVHHHVYASTQDGTELVKTTTQPAKAEKDIQKFFDVL
jgi:hypothetical protein